MAEAIRKQYQAITKQEKELAKMKNKNKCRCHHTDSHNDPNLTRTKDGGQFEYMCKECTENIDFTKVSDEEKRKARKIIVNQFNIIKMLLGDSEEDKELGKRIAKAQYLVEFELEALDKAATKKSSRGKRNRRNDYGVEIERPSVR